MHAGAYTSAAILIKYRFKRLCNFLATGFKRRSSSDKRTATARKGTRGWVTALILFGFIFFSSVQQAYHVISKTFTVLGNAEISAQQQKTFPGWNCVKPKYERKKLFIQCEPLENAPASLTPGPVGGAITLELVLLFFSVLLLNVASKELTSPEWDLEWLITLPISIPELIGVRVLERTLANPAGLLIIWPFVSVVSWKAGLGYAAIPLGLICALALLYFEAACRTVIDTGLRLVVSAAKLRNIQALTSLFASVSFMLILSIGLNEQPVLLRWSLSPGLDWLKWTPAGAVSSVLTAGTFAMVFKGASLVAVQLLIAYFFTSRLLLSMLKLGVISGGARDGSRRLLTAAELPKSTGAKREGALLSPIQRREFKLLARDRNFMVQTLVLPAFITGMQFFFTGTLKWIELFKGSFTRLAATAFGVAAYSLVYSAFQVLNSEGKSLWLLYTFPNRIEALLREKIYLWLAVALIYPVLLFGSGIYISGLPDMKSLVLIGVVLIGIVIYATVAACFGVFASDPLAEDPRQRVRVDYVYLYLILASFYTYAIFANSYWQKLSLLVLSALMALALVQKARDHLPFLLDPTESPKPSVSLSDGLIAALVFFVIQGITGAMLSSSDKPLTGRGLTIAFCVAGFVTFLSLRTIYWRKKTTGVPKIFGSGWARAIGYGAGAGLIAGGLGIAYVHLIARYGLFADIKKIAIAGSEWWLAALLIVAAPLFEEFIFRGIIFQGLRRTWSLATAAFASAAIFAIVHPPVAVIPVFGLAVLAALSYSRTRILLTPISAHSVYNTIIVFYQTNIFHL